MWTNFKEKYLGKVEYVFSWLFNIAGLILAVLSFIKPDTTLGWRVVVSIIVFNSLFLITVSIYETYVYKRGENIKEQIENKKDGEINKLKHSLKLNYDLEDKMRYYFKRIFLTLNESISELYAVNSKFSEAKEDVKKFVDGSGTNSYIGDVDSEESFEKYIKKTKEKSEVEYRKSMLAEFHRFLDSVTYELKIILDSSLREKGSILETSISVKQFSRIITDPEDISDVVVITTFRDRQTYLQGKREIGKEKYSINRNTDFIYCLFNPYFLKNNIKSEKDDKTYSNQHEGFLQYYNCTIVVPIKYKYPDCSHIFGFLTCDILNDDLSVENLLDNKMAEIMETTANVIGTYFDNMDYQWECVLEDDFLDIVYTMKSLDNE